MQPDIATDGASGEISGDEGSEWHPATSLVRLAPTEEAGLPCDNVELAFDFDAEVRDFNVDHAFWMMWFAERAFFSSGKATQDELAELGFTRYQRLSDSSTGLELFVAASQTVVVVAFRGSGEARDWVANFDFPQDEGSQHSLLGRVHRGFAASLSPSFDELERTVRSFASTGQTVWLTGHSLGAAQATLAATRLVRMGHKVGPLYTYAAPRVGDAVFAKDAFEKLRGRVYRIVHELDVVAHAPPAAVAAEEASHILPLGQTAGAQALRGFDYRHVGQKMWLRSLTGNELSPMPEMSDADDLAYWREVAQGGSLGFLNFLRKQAFRHAQQRYLCRLLALRRGGD